MAGILKMLKDSWKIKCNFSFIAFVSFFSNWLIPKTNYLFFNEILTNRSQCVEVSRVNGVFEIDLRC